MLSRNSQLAGIQLLLFYPPSPPLLSTGGGVHGHRRSVPPVPHPARLPEPARDGGDQARHGVRQAGTEELPGLGTNHGIIQVQGGEEEENIA